MVRLVRLTPYAVLVERGDEIIAIKESGKIAVAVFDAEVVGEVDGIKIRRVAFKGVKNLPDPRPDTYYVVPLRVFHALQLLGVRRPDILAPDDSEDSIIYAAEGRIIGVRYLQVLW